jgi:hypothetical protein
MRVFLQDELKFIYGSVPADLIIDTPGYSNY